MRPARLAILVACLATAAHAADWERQPLSGIAYNTKERSAITYDCSLASQGQIHCKFIQMAVRKKVAAKDLSAKLAEAEKEAAKWQASPKECQQIKATVAELRSQGTSSVAQVDPRDLAVTEEMIAAFTIACDSGSKDKLVAALRRSVERDARSCRVSSHEFEQTFQRVATAENQGPVWVTRGEPSGPCGVVQLSRFEQITPFQNEFKAWNFVSRKAITNPSGKTALFGSCKNLDEESYTFSWNSSEGLSSWADCDQIEFGVF